MHSVLKESFSLPKLWSILCTRISTLIDLSILSPEGTGSLKWLAGLLNALECSSLPPLLPEAPRPLSELTCLQRSSFLGWLDPLGAEVSPEVTLEWGGTKG